MKVIVEIYDREKQSQILKELGFENGRVEIDEKYILVNTENKRFFGQYGMTVCRNLISRQEFERLAMNGTKFESKEQSLALISIIKGMGIKLHSEVINHIEQGLHYGLSFNAEKEWLGTSFSGTLPVSELLKQAEEMVENQKKQYDIGEYKTVITRDELKVGCQTITFEKVSKIYNRMVELRKC